MKMNAKKIKRNSPKIISLALAALIGASVLVPVCAAEAENTEKEEVVYINLNDDGSVNEINVVNIFDLDESGKITDYGDYESVRNMTTNDKINSSNGVVTINAEKGKLYYEGRLKNETIPWNISIHYFIDDKEYTADEIAGKSGALKIKIDIDENKSCEGGFFDGYALQTSLTLDTGICKNISDPDATVANVGSDKQLTYTILPGKGADIEITADVTDFEMGGISINGVPLSLNIEVDDEELKDKINELTDAIDELDGGASDLKDGTKELKDAAGGDLKSGTQELKDGADTLNSGSAALKDGGESVNSGAESLQNGAQSLDDGAKDLNSGIAQVQTAIDSLNAQSSTLTGGSAEFKSALAQLNSALSGLSVNADDVATLTSASSAIKDGIDGLVSGAQELQQSVSFEAYKAVMLQNGLDVDALRQSNSSAIESLQTTISSLNEQIAALSAMGADTSQLEAQVSQLQNIAVLLGANNSNIDGTQAYLDSVNQSLSALLQGAQNLESNYSEFDSKINELADTLTNMTYQLSQLAEAVNTLVGEYEKLDGGVGGYTDAVAQIAVGYSQISDGSQQLVSGSGELKNGSQTLYGGTRDLLSGIVEIYDGTGSLKNGAGELDDGVAELITGISELYDGTHELKDGTSQMKDETSNIDSEIDEKIDDLLDSVTGGNVETESFVSAKNENIDSVQFVIKTEAIEIPEAEEPAEEEEEQLSFWQKLLRLFGLY